MESTFNQSKFYAAPPTALCMRCSPRKWSFVFCECGPAMSERANWSAHTDTQQQVVAARRLLFVGGLRR